MFHSRGPSPVNIKGRNNVEKYAVEGGFRRNDPKRHSSPRINQRSVQKMQLSPPKFIPSRAPLVATVQNNVRGVQPQNGHANRRMFWSPERQSQHPKTVLQRKNSAPSPEKMALPVVEKLLQHSDLCENKNFLMKIEQLIAEFQAKTKFDNSVDYGVIQYNSLPVNLGVDATPKPCNPYQRKSPVENGNGNGKSPSKIPLPTFYSKCLT